MRSIRDDPFDQEGTFASHLGQVVKALTGGYLVPFLGSGANRVASASDGTWQAGQTSSLPLGNELAGYLANTFGLPFDPPPDLARISEHIALRDGTGPLYLQLRSLLNVDYPVTPLHSYFAKLPARLEAKGYPKTPDPWHRRLLLVTTNYDDLLERAFASEGQPCHCLVYAAEGENRGQFLHQPPGGSPQPIKRPNQYQGLMHDEHPVVLKLHGTVDRTTADHDSFVVTEDHYIDYLTRTDIARLIPIPLPAILKNSSVLFLGYSLRDWNLRVIIHRLLADRKLSWPWWAVMRNPDDLDRLFWKSHGIDLIDHDLGSFLAAIEARTP